jgi:hypothetical protein
MLDYVKIAGGVAVVSPDKDQAREGRELLEMSCHVE